MSRQDANAVFARTSFLYGGNAAYIEDLYARYEKDPNAVDAEWRAFFQGLKDQPADVATSARGASWKKANGPLRPGGDREEAWRQDCRESAGQRRRAFLRRRHAGDARFNPRTDADPRLPHPRPFPR